MNPKINNGTESLKRAPWQPAGQSPAMPHPSHVVEPGNELDADAKPGFIGKIVNAMLGTGGAAATDVDALVNPRLTKQVRLGLESIPQPSNEILANAGRIALVSCPKGLKAEIAAYQAKFDAALTLASRHDQRHAANAFRARQAEIESGVMATGRLDECLGENLEQWEEKFRHKLQSAVALSKTFSPKVAELVKPHLARFISEVRETADQNALNEQSRSENLGVPWVPSNYVLTLFKCAEHVELYGGRGPAPKDVAAFLGQLHEQ